MKKIFYIITAVLSLLVSCTIETSDNGDLDGMWLLERMDSLSNNAITTFDEHKITWSFQYDLLQLSNLHDKPVIYRFERTDDKLILNNPSMFDRTLGDTLVTDVEVLRQFGVNAIYESYYIKSLSKNDMVLESSLLRLHLKKH